MPKANPKACTGLKTYSKDAIKQAYTIYRAARNVLQARKVFQAAEDAFKRTIFAALAADDAEDAAR
jgi:hypothetical protein